MGPVRNVGENVVENPVLDLNARREAVQKLHDACSRTVSRAMFLLLGVSLFIVVTILNTPDSALLDPAPRFKIPLVANMSKVRAATLKGTNFQGASLHGADLRGTDLSSAKGLTREQVKTAVTDSSTRFPDNL